MTAQCVGRFFRTDGKYLGRVYKEHLSGFKDWEQREHAGEWVLHERNMGERLSIDETMLHHDLFTFLTNKDGHCKKGTLIAAVKGTTVADVTKHLSLIPEEKGKHFKLRGKQKSVGASAVAVYLAMYAVVDVVCVEVY